jgi:chromosome partitioning protein
MEKVFTPSKILKLFRSDKTKHALFKSEEMGLIPKADRIKWGQHFVRAWQKKDLPAIGKAYGFLPTPSAQKVISVYTAKGGVLKTTVSYNLARMIALNGIKTLVIGLDVQCSITDLLSTTQQEENIEDIHPIPGLYEATKPIVDGGITINDIIRTSDIPTLHYIPETVNLNKLEQKIRDEKKREHFLAKFITGLKQNYDVIIFDNSPNWNFLIQNSLVAADIVISPMGCDIGTYRAVNQNIQLINDFKNDMELNWKNFVIIPTLLENTKLSLQIVSQYNTLYPELITKASIRRAVKGQESSLQNCSVIESDPSSPLANDYYDIITELWTKIRS